MKNLIIIWLLFMVSLQEVGGQDLDYYTPRRLRGVSTGIHHERAPVPMGDTLLVYMATQSSNSARKIHDQYGNEFFYLFYAKRDNRDAKFGNSKQLKLQPRNSLGEGTPSFAKEGSLMVFSKFYEVSRTNMKSGLFFADRSGDTWINIRSFEHNDPGHGLFTPYLSDDGNTLYFSADFADAIGSYDIYVSHYTNGRWSKPENLGRSVNSTQTEIYPFYHPIGRLFFSSDGFDNGRQGFDIFQSDYFDGEWQPAEKIPYRRINTGNNEYAFYISEDFEWGYFERRGGTYDIYEITTDIPVFKEPAQSKSNYHRRFLLRENNLDKDTIDPELFEMAWVIDDTIKIYETETIYAFPGPGTYNIRFEVYDKLLDSIRVVLNRDQVVPFRTQATIVCPDTVYVNEEFRLDGRETYLPDIEIDEYYWDFGDGTKAEGVRARHTYKYPGTYRIILGVKEKTSSRKEEARLVSNFKDVVVKN